MVTGCRFEAVGDCKVCKYNQDCDRAEGLKRKSGMASTVFKGSGAIGLIMKDICSKHFKEEPDMAKTTLVQKRDLLRLKKHVAKLPKMGIGVYLCLNGYPTVTACGLTTTCYINEGTRKVENIDGTITHEKCFEVWQYHETYDDEKLIFTIGSFEGAAKHAVYIIACCALYNRLQEGL